MISLQIPDNALYYEQTMNVSFPMYNSSQIWMLTKKNNNDTVSVEINAITKNCSVANVILQT